MASTVSENGDTTEEVSQSSSIGGPKVNGEVNGSFEEPMEVDDSPVKPVKKINSSDINCINDNQNKDNNSVSELVDQTNSISENSASENDAAVESEVPECEEATSSNGYGEQHNEGDKEVENESSNREEEDGVGEEEEEDEGQDGVGEEGVGEEEEEGVGEEEEGVGEEEEGVGGEEEEGVGEEGLEHEEGEERELEQEESENLQNEAEDDDDDVVLMDADDPQDPFGADSNAVEEPEVRPAHEIDNSNLMETSDGEPMDDPFSSDHELKDTEKTECKDESVKKDLEESVEKTSDKSSEKSEKDKSQNEETEKGTEESQKENGEPAAKIESDKMEEGENEKCEESPDKLKNEEDSEKTPDKGKKKKAPQQPINVTPRRSSRNVNKPKTYIDEPDIKGTSSSTPAKKVSDDPDIEEIVPQDPLAMDSPMSDKKNKKTVVVNDPKRLVEIASGSKPSKPGKKEPTLVIIDTNSILSGRGPVPITASPPITSVAGPSRSQGYSVLPVALPAQGMYPQPMRQIKPMIMQPSGLTVTPSPPPPAAKPPVILPSLTDDMYVVEAPSFIVPYVYEKPPIKPLKNFVEQVEQAIKEIKAQLEKEKDEEKKVQEEKKAEEKRAEEKKAEEKKAEEKKEEDLKAEEKKMEGEEMTEDGEKDEKMKEDSSEKRETEEVVRKNEDDVDKDESMEVDSDSPKPSKKNEASTSAEIKEVKEETKETEKSVENKSVESKSESEKSSEKVSEDGKPDEGEKKKPSNSYFDNPLGKFFIQIGVNLVQEHVQTDLLRSQKRKKEREGAKCTPEVQQAMNSLIRSLEFSKETNEPFKLELKKCEFCSFKTESALVMAHHLETPHMRNYVYRCNFCPLEVRSPHDILYHMEAEHNVRGRLERAPAFHQCPSCPFEDNQKGKLSRHLLSCAKKYRPERNQEPPLDFEPPAKIPRVSRNRPNLSPGTAVYQAAMSGLKQGPTGHPLLPKLVPAPSPAGMIRGRGRPQMINRYLGDMRNPATAAALQQKAMAAQMRPGMLYRPSGSNAQPQVLLPASYQLAGTQLYQVSNHSRGLGQAQPLPLPTQAQSLNAAAAAASVANKTSVTAVGASTAKLLQQPSISITPLPRQQPPPAAPAPPANKPGRPAGATKATFVICEICDGYIKDLEQLRNHMQWIHKVKIHPKMIYNRPPLNCQKCQFRFFTDQGLERHLLGSHGLVTSSMQEAANKGKDGGRCPVCGRVYQWKLLNHVARDHNMSLKPAHLSYKCTVCTATFGMYKQFENHVYSAHSVVAKRVMDKKPSTTAQPSTSSQGDMLKPLKINDEITIIPQPARSKTKPAGSNRNPQKKV